MERSCATVGIPLAGASFAKAVTQPPWQFVGITLLYELAVLIFGFVAKVWQQLADSGVKRSADWINSRIRIALSGYQKRYRDYLTYEHRDFDVKG